SDNHLATLHQILHEDPPKVKEFNTKVPGWLSEIINGCLVKDRILRIPDGYILADALRNKETPDYANNAFMKESSEFDTNRFENKNNESKKYFKNKKSKKHKRDPVDKHRPLYVAIFVTLFIILLFLGIYVGGM
ncbi:MAG: hypothetical protein JXB49_09575, partial [Bacteroidales bacterium]|nr:hypothetical protein [Bacteroidales bacterium]